MMTTSDFWGETGVSGVLRPVAACYRGEFVGSIRQNAIFTTAN